MAQLTASQVYNLARQAGLSDQDALTATAIAYVESGFKTDAVGVNRDQWSSRDRGLWQINDHWNPQCDDACAFDPVCNAATMARLSNNGKNWKPWSSYNNSRYKSALDMVSQEISTGGGGGVNEIGLSVPNPLDSLNPLSGIADQVAGWVKGIAWLTNPHNMTRIVVAGIGVGAMGLGTLILIKDAKR